MQRQSTSKTGPGASWEADIGGVRVFFGEGRAVEAADLVQQMGRTRVLMVADPGVEAAGHLSALLAALRQAGTGVQLFTEFGDNPTLSQVSAGRDYAASHDPDCLVAIGGGSALDCAKGINFLLTNGGSMKDYWGYGKAHRALLPAIAVPTTAGTGSEAQSYALITDPETRRKMACGDPSARFRSVILDPALLTTVPRPVAAAAGIDAVAHAVESFVSMRSNPISRMLALRAWELLDGHLTAMLAAHSASHHYGEVQLGAHLAGAAIEQSMLGAAHACANPLTGDFGIAHGQAIGLVLPHVVRFNAEAIESQYRVLARAANLPTTVKAGDALARRIEVLRQELELPERLRDVGVTSDDLAALAESAAMEWTVGFNPRPIAAAELKEIYRAAF